MNFLPFFRAVAFACKLKIRIKLLSFSIGWSQPRPSSRAPAPVRFSPISLENNLLKLSNLYLNRICFMGNFSPFELRTHDANRYHISVCIRWISRPTRKQAWRRERRERGEANQRKAKVFIHKFSLDAFPSRRERKNYCARFSAYYRECFCFYVEISF